MDTQIGVGLLVGAVAGSSIYIWNSESYSKTQKTFLLLFMLFPPLQWVSIIIVAAYNSNKNYFGELTNTTKKRTDGIDTQNLMSKKEIPKPKESISTNEQKGSLLKLLNTGMLSESEYEKKIQKLNSFELEKKVENSFEYKEIESLFNSGVLTEIEKKNMVKILTERINEFLHAGKDFNEFESNLFNAKKLNIKIELDESLIDHLIGKWVNENGYFYLRESKSLIQTYEFELVKKGFDSVKGNCDVVENKIVMKIRSIWEYGREEIEILEIGSNILKYRNNNKLFIAYREVL